MAQLKYNIVTIGDCSIDYFVEPTGYQISRATGTEQLSFPLAQKLPINTFQVFAGGNALNTAVSFKRLGLRTAIISQLGDDLGAELILSQVKQERIDSQFLSRSKKTETNSSIILVTAGERTILSYHCEKNYPVPKNLSTDWVYITSMGAGFEKVYRRFGSYATKFKIAFNPGSQQLLRHRTSVRGLATRTKLLFVNIEEGRGLLGGSTASPRQLLNGLKRLGAEKVFVTDGKQGAYAIDSSGCYKIGIYPAKRIDATGAGDAFASGATCAIILGYSTQEALRWGTINAAKEVAKIGVQNGLCDRSELMAELTKQANFRPNKF